MDDKGRPTFSLPGVLFGIWAVLIDVSKSGLAHKGGLKSSFLPSSFLITYEQNP